MSQKIAGILIQDGTPAFICTTEDFHPYECGGMQEGCRHCKKEKYKGHNPKTCALCNA